MADSSINGVSLYWEVSGDGEPVILVHGSWGDHNNWAQVVPALSSSLRVVTYDRRGHSASERPTGQGSIDEDVADLAGLIEHVFGGPAHVVGNSFGAAISLRLAIQRPDLIRSVTAHEPPLFVLLEGQADVAPMLRIVRERIDAVARLLQAGDMRAGAQLFVETIAFGPGAWAQLPQPVRDTFIYNAPTWLDELQEPQSLNLDLERLSAFSGPALLSFGGASPPFFPMVVEQVARALPHAQRHQFPHAGHVPHLSHPQEYVDLVVGFISRVADRPAASGA
jgi:pimeloyl-ACP methyl ester carboxylesterase